MRISDVRANNRKKVFEVRIDEGEYSFPFARLSLSPSSSDRVREVYPDQEVGCEAFTYRLESGAEDTVHMDAVLEYNEDPTLLNEILLHRLTVELHRAMGESSLSKREMIRRLRTSPSQLYRILDPTYSGKSVGQMIFLLRLLGREVDVVVRPSPAQVSGDP